MRSFFAGRHLDRAGAALDHLRQGIHLRGYAQKNPKQEYKREAFELFSDMLERIKRDVTQLLTSVQVQREEQLEAVAEAVEEAPAATRNMQYHHADYDDALTEAAEDDAGAEPFERAGDKVGRNDPCPCGSGKKYKKCHGA